MSDAKICDMNFLGVEFVIGMMVYQNLKSVLTWEQYRLKGTSLRDKYSRYGVEKGVPQFQASTEAIGVHSIEIPAEYTLAGLFDNHP